MTSSGKEEAYKRNFKSTNDQTKVFKVGLIATASALAGGLAVAWWYRDTLKKLRNPVHSENLPKIESLESEFPDADQDHFDESEPGALPRLVQD
jgi:hypothetical protein